MPPHAAGSREIIIGHANTWHDPAIAMAEGSQLFAEGLDRHTRCKRALDMPRPWYSWPAVRAWLAANGGFPIQDGSVTTISPWSRIGAMDAVKTLGNPSGNPFGALIHSSILMESIAENQFGWMLRGQPPRPFAPPIEPFPGVQPVGRVTWQSKTLMHQLAHAANAVYTSPFDECSVIVMDEWGEGSALTYLFYQENKFLLIHQAAPQVSLGLLYGAIAQFCGLDPYQGDEWSLGGLAALGRYQEDLFRFFRDRIAVSGLDVEFKAAGKATNAFDLQSWTELEKMVGGFRRPDDDDVMKSADLAFNFQKAFDEVVFEVAYNFAHLGLSPNLAFAGGCALHAPNGKLVPHSGFERLHVPFAPGEDGNSLGAVLYEKYHSRGEPRPLETLTPYLGSAVDLERLAEILSLGDIPHHRASDEGALCDEVAGLLAEGKIVGWVQGRAEFGPRALGNRSVLADPRAADMKDRVNRRLERGALHRPLGPSILMEHGEEYFEDFQPSPYMERALEYRPEVRDKVSAVVDPGGTGRLHTVTGEANPLFHRLLSAFHARTGVPLLLNTPLSVAGAPIVHSVEDALAVFYTCGLDRLVIGPNVIEK